MPEDTDSTLPKAARGEANREVSEAEETIRAIAETASDAIITIDEDSTIRFVNSGAEKTFGYTAQQMMGSQLTMLMPEYLRHRHRASLKRYVDTGQKHIAWTAVELAGLHKSGKEIPLEISFAEFTRNGRPFFTGIVRDITERKQMEEARRRSEEYFQSLIENVADIITVLNQDGTRRYVSPAIERSLGYKPEELIGKTPFDLLHPEEGPKLMKLFADGISNLGGTVSQEYRIRHKDGSWRIHEATAHNLLNVPAVGGVVINSRDVTERKRTERRLAAQHAVTRVLAESRTLVEAAPRVLQAICESLGWDFGAIWELDRDDNVLRCLEVWRAPGSPVKEFEAISRQRTFSPGVGLPGRVWASGSPAWINDVASDANFPRAAIAAREGLHGAFGFPILLGEEVLGVIEFFSIEIQEPDESVIEMLSTVGSQIGQFIERKRVEEERNLILEREQKLRREAEQAAGRIRNVQTVTDAALAHLAFDELLAEMLDRICDALRVDTAKVLLLERESNELVTWAAKGTGEEDGVGVRVPFGSGFAGHVAAEGRAIHIDDINKTKVVNPRLRQKGVRSLLGVPLMVEGRVIGVMHVGTFKPHSFSEDDSRVLQLVADRIALAIDNARMYREEKSLRQEAEAASRVKDDFLTTVSHELRTPLTPIIAWIHMIRTGMVPVGEFEHGIEVIERNTQALKRLINDLLDMSAILSGKMRINKEPVQLESIVLEAIETVGPRATTHDIQLEISLFDSTHSITVEGDRTRLVQVFWNLLDNAVKFSAKGGRVRVICEADGNEAVVHVEDEGQGIAPGFLPHVFERFRQADSSKMRSHGGLGLGLALVKSFVEAHGGAVEAESKGEWRGSRFTVHLPRQPGGNKADDGRRTQRSARAPRRDHLSDGR